MFGTDCATYILYSNGQVSFCPYRQLKFYHSKQLEMIGIENLCPYIYT